MINLKKIITAVALLAVTAAGLAADSISVFSRENADYWFATPRDAFEAYIGNWTGSETMTAEGREIMKAEVAQSYVPSVSSKLPRLVCSGKIIAKGKSYPTSSYMYLNGDVLELEIVTVEKDIVPYIGVVAKNSVYWTPKYLFYVYDVQKDFFYVGERGIIMSSTSKKYVEMPNGAFAGYIEVGMILQRDNSHFPVKKASNSVRKEFSLSPFGSQN